MELPLNSCSIVVYLRGTRIPALKITGVYFAPALRPTEEQVRVLTDKKSRFTHDGQEIGRVMGGDFNHPRWAAVWFGLVAPGS